MSHDLMASPQTREPRAPEPANPRTARRIDVMANCRDIESKLAAYIDGDQPAADRLAVEIHLRACPSCRTRARAEQAVHDLMCSRRLALRGCAPSGLRSRCAGQRRSSFAGFLPRRPWVSLSVAASLVLVTAVFLVFGWGSSVETYAAQLAADHLKCFQFPPDGSAAVDATLLGKIWQESSGWTLKVAASSPSEQLQLLGVRRCRPRLLQVAWRTALGLRPQSPFRPCTGRRARS
jgi:anti-sigma factor RsiW